MLNEFMLGFRLPFTGAALIMNTPGLRRWAALPLAVNVVVYAGVLALAFWLIGALTLPEASWEFWGATGEYLSSAVNWLGPVFKWLICVPLVATVCYFSFTFIGMLVAAPFNDILSEKIEAVVTGGEKAMDQPLRLTLQAAFVSLCSTARFFAKQIFYTLLCLPLLFVPGVGALLLFLVTSYYAGLGFFDLGMARNNLSHKHKMAGAREYCWRVLGLGAAMELLFMIPLVGLVLLPAGVAGGTLLYCAVDWRALLAREKLDFPQGFNPPQKTGK